MKLSAAIVKHQECSCQVLPLCPPEDIFWSPYSGLDALCGNTLMISLEELVKDGLLSKGRPARRDPRHNSRLPKGAQAILVLRI